MSAVVEMTTSTDRWLDNQLARGMRGAFAVKGELTPELAQALLHRNDANRKLSDKKVRQYAEDIKAGNWELNGETVILAADGKMNNGQHRCAAVNAAGISIDTFFVFGVQRASRMTVDQGVKRTIDQYFRMAGHSYSTILAAAVLMAEQYERLGVIARSSPRSTPAQAQQYLADNPSIEASVALVGATNYNIPMSKAAVAALHFLFAKHDAVAADSFVKSFLTGTNLASDSPILLCRNRLLAEARGRKRMHYADQAEAMVRCWNAMREGRTLTRLRLGPDFPAIV